MLHVFGGLLLENLALKDDYFALQQHLFEDGLTHGIQLRVAHPRFTPGLTSEKLARVLSRLPGKEVFFHCGAENTGVDFGGIFDECGEFKSRASGRSWDSWNLDTLRGSIRMAEVARKLGYNVRGIVVHPGYGEDKTDAFSLSRILTTLEEFYGYNIFLENVPPIVDKALCPSNKDMSLWSRNNYWGFGGTPDDMGILLRSLGRGWKCLIDFTHLAVMVNQAKKGFMAIAPEWRDIDQAIAGYFALPHSSVCHFSGVPPEDVLADSHDYLANFSPAIRQALRKMEVVCLEIPFKPQEEESVKNAIREFRRQYVD